METEKKNITQMLDCINKNSNVLKKEEVQLSDYEQLNLCEDYKTFLSNVGHIHFGDLNLVESYSEEDNMVGYLYQQIYSMHAPGDSFEDEYAYTNKLFYEIGSAYNGDSLVQAHSGKYRGMVFMTDHETFPTEDELEDEIGDLKSKSSDELLKILLKDFDCLMTFEDIEIENAADFFIKKMSALPKLENKNIKEMLGLIADKKDAITKVSIDVSEYADLNLCEDYKTFLQEIGNVKLKEIGVTEIAENVKDSYSPLIFNNIYQLHAPSSNFAEADENENYPDATAYTSQLFYEVGSDGSDGSCLVQLHSGNYRGMLMYAEYGEFPLDGELVEELGSLENKTADEIIDHLIEHHGCFRKLTDLGIENFADFFIAKLQTIPQFEKPSSVPIEAIWVDKDKQWELGEKDVDGNNIGHWKWWAAPSGNVASVAHYEGNGTMNFERYHTDGTISQKGQKVENKQTGIWVWQQSDNPTTENWLSGVIFRCEAEYDNGNMLWVKYWNKENDEIDGYGNILNKL